MGLLDGVLNLLLGTPGAGAEDVAAVLDSTSANAGALSSTATANADTLVHSVIGGMNDMVNTTLETTFTGVQSLVESSMAGSADAMNSVAGTAINFTEASSAQTWDSAGNQLSESQAVSHNGGATIMAAYASDTLGPLMAGVGGGVSGMMTGVGTGAGQAMANLGAGVPAMLPGLAGALGGDISASLGTAHMLANTNLAASSGGGLLGGLL
jgi:hypothetical protein